MNLISIFSVISISLLLVAKAQEQPNDQVCPFGAYTKEAPSQENNLKACKEYQCNSCCTEELTEQLVLVPLQMVGILNYSQCDGGLSTACSNYMSYIQCYYQCSPNLYPWLHRVTRRLENLPICASFCGDWYEACKDDRTCVDETDWLRGFQKVQVGDDPKDITLQCKTGQPCRKYSEVYENAQKFCTEMWPGVTMYQTDESSCVIPGDQGHNKNVVKAVEGEDAPFSTCESVHYTDTGMIVGIVVGVIAGAAMLTALVIFIIRTKEAKKHKAKGGSQPKPKEMEELNPATLE
uniref:riboflavin-binding protein-like n=1 Tax=Styela clava TaxID=7725 RepID=UPI001939497A|nr:riboflavin-binding protein-like [Styela clava]